MSLFLKIYYYINVAVGILNVHYEPSSNSIKLNYWPQLIYCMIVNIFSIIILNFAIYWNYMYITNCYRIVTSSIYMLILLFVTYMEITVITLDIWLKRKRIYKILIQFRRLYKYYSKDIHSQENQHVLRKCKHLLFSKYFTAILSSLIIAAQGHASLRKATCRYAKYVKVINYYFTIMSPVTILNTLNIYMALIYLYLCGYLLIKRLNKILKDIKFMHNIDRCLITAEDRYLNGHQLWRERLAQEVKILTRDVYQLRSITGELMSIYQVQLAMILLSVFVNLAGIAFYTVMLIFLVNLWGPIRALHTFIIFAVDVLNVIVFLNIFSLIIDNFQAIATVSSEIEMYAIRGNRQQLIIRDDLTQEVS